MRLVRQIMTVAASVVMVSTGFAVNAADFNQQELTQKFEKLGVSVNDIRESDIQGLLEVHTSGGTLFATPDGKQFIAGTLYQFNSDGTYDDVIAKRQAPLNAKKIAAMADDMIVYKAKNEKYVVTVFTDITCGYCVKLHSEMQKYNDLGITVRYLAFPRAGGNSQVAEQMEAIWSSDDRNAAFSQAILKHKLPADAQSSVVSPVDIEKQYNLGRQLGVAGTPAIFLPDGMMVGGYLPASRLLQRLQQM